MAELTWDELKKVVKGWTISIAEKFGITEIRCHSNNITNVVLSLANAEDDEESKNNRFLHYPSEYRNICNA